MGSPETSRKIEVPSNLIVSEEGVRKWLNESVALQLRADSLEPSIHSDMDMMMTREDIAEIRGLRERSELLLGILIDVVHTEDGSLAEQADKLYRQAREEKASGV
jgi:hypothetical protein